MCLAVPRRVLQRDGDRVEVEWDGAPLWVQAAGVESLEPGEYVLVHAGQVLERVSADEAEEILALYASLESATFDVSSADVALETPPVETMP